MPFSDSGKAMFQEESVKPVPSEIGWVNPFDTLIMDPPLSPSISEDRVVEKKQNVNRILDRRM
jgi:hypothetical protein